MGLEFPVSFKVTGDSKAAVKAFEDLEKSQKKAAAAAYELMSAEEKLFADMSNALKAIPSQADSAAQGFQRMQADLLKLNAGLSGLQLGLALVAGVGGHKMGGLKGIQAELDNTKVALKGPIQEFEHLNDVMQGGYVALSAWHGGAVAVVNIAERMAGAFQKISATDILSKGAQFYEFMRQKGAGEDLLNIEIVPESKRKAARAARITDPLALSTADRLGAITDQFSADWDQEEGAPDWLSGVTGRAQGWRSMDDLRASVAGTQETLATSASGVAESLRNAGDAVRDYGETMSLLADRTTLAGSAFGAFSDGVASAVGAAIDGNRSMGEAFKQAAGSALKSLAIESTVRALYETASGLAALANPVTAPAAGPHFAAAAKFAATAALAGVGAAALGGGGGGGYGRGGASPSSGAGGGYASGPLRDFSEGGQTIIVQVGDGFVGKPAELAEAIGDTVSYGQRAGITTTAPGPIRFQ